MNLTSRIAWRSLVSRPARTATAVLGIAVGVAAVLSVLIVDHNTILTEELRRPSLSGKPDLEIRPVDATLSGTVVPQALARDQDLRRVLPLFQSRIRVSAGAGRDEKSADVELFALDPAAGDAFSAWKVVQGDGFQSSTADEVLLPEPLAAELGLEVGAELRLQRALPSRRECRDGSMVQTQDEQLEGEAKSFRVVGIVENDNLGRRRAVLVPFERGLALYAGAHVQPLYWARLAPEAIYQDVRERLKTTYVVDKPKSALVGERVDQRAFRKSIRIAACLSLLLGLFVIYNAFSLSLVERVREIGLLRALGLTSGQIAAAVVLEGALLALLGCAVGLGLAIGVSYLMKQVGITTLGYGKPLVLHEIPWDLVGIILAAGALAALLGVVAPLLRVRRLSVIEAVRAGQIAYQPDPTRFVRALLLALLPGALLVLYVAATPPLGERQDEVFKIIAKIALWLSLVFGVALLAPNLIHRAVEAVLRLFLAGRPIERPIAAASTRGAHHRVFGSALGLALVLAAVLIIHAITTSLVDETARFADSAMHDRVFVRSRFLPREDIAKAAGAAGVVDCYSLSAEVRSQFPIRGVAPEHAIRWVPELAADGALAAEFAAGRSLVMSESLATNFGYVVGDQVRLSTYGGAYPVKVAVISDEFGYYPDDRNFAVMALPTFRNLFCVDDSHGTQYVFHVDPEQPAGRVRDAIVSFLVPRDLQEPARTAREVKEFYLADMRRDFWVFQVVLLLTAALAFVGLWNSLTVALLERRREIGLLRTLGFTPGQLGGMLSAESAALGLVGGALAILAGLPVSTFVVDAIRVISRLDVRYVATALDFVLVPVIAIALALIATVPPALRVRAMVVASATRMD